MGMVDKKINNKDFFKFLYFFTVVWYTIGCTEAVIQSNFGSLKILYNTVKDASAHSVSLTKITLWLNILLSSNQFLMS